MLTVFNHKRFCDVTNNIFLVIATALPPPPASAEEVRWRALVDAYRTHGYRCAQLDPLNLTPTWRDSFESVSLCSAQIIVQDISDSFT